VSDGFSSTGRPRLSFLTPAYRTEAYLADTIQSVLDQTSTEWELVVVDNGNSESIAKIVESYSDPRIRLVRQENRGYTGGVMAAAAVARGDYISVLDSDDQLMPEFVHTMLKYIDAHPEVDAVGCDAHLFHDGDERPAGRGYLHSIGSRVPSADGDLLSVDDVLAGRVPYYTCAIRKAAWQEVGGYQPGVDGVDESVLIWLRLAGAFEVRLLPAKLARYRVREDSLSREPDKVEGFEESLIHTFEQFAAESADAQHQHIVQAPVRRLRYHQALRRARWAFSDGDIGAARRFARDALAQQRTLRAVAIVLLLKFTPRLLRSVYPLKQRLGQAARRALQRDNA
jgi:glycosyltransferase involved in cell wall biosynthesis